MRLIKPHGIWCDSRLPRHSAARIIAEHAMAALKLDPADIEQRNLIIGQIGEPLNLMLDAARRSYRPRKAKPKVNHTERRFW